ncbi:MAG: hypothetical protein H6Q76_2298 [Firmicutes bacterium]|nr:hypothetical protein [Bacillota bacterium]
MPLTGDVDNKRYCSKHTGGAMKMDKQQSGATLREVITKLGVDSLAFSWILADMEAAFDCVGQHVGQ